MKDPAESFRKHCKKYSPVLFCIDKSIIGSYGHGHDPKKNRLQVIEGDVSITRRICVEEN